MTLHELSFRTTASESSLKYQTWYRYRMSNVYENSVILIRLYPSSYIQLICIDALARAIGDSFASRLLFWEQIGTDNRLASILKLILWQSYFTNSFSHSHCVLENHLDKENVLKLRCSHNKSNCHLHYFIGFGVMKSNCCMSLMCSLTFRNTLSVQSGISHRIAQDILMEHFCFIIHMKSSYGSVACRSWRLQSWNCTGAAEAFART